MAIKTGKKNLLTNEDFNPKNGKARVTMYLDLDVLDKAREMAATGGGHGKYQTLLNEKLRESILGEKNEVLDRLEAVERVVFKKRA